MEEQDLIIPNKKGATKAPLLSDAEDNAGNIDLYKQPKVKNPDGTTSTVDSRSYNIDGKEVLLPSVTQDGRHLKTDDEIINEYNKTARHLGKFNSVDEANKYASKLHEDYASGKYDKPEKSKFADLTDKIVDWFSKPLLPEKYESEGSQDPNIHILKDTAIGKFYGSGIPIPAPGLKYLYENALRPMSSPAGLALGGLGLLEGYLNRPKAGNVTSPIDVEQPKVLPRIAGTAKEVRALPPVSSPEIPPVNVQKPSFIAGPAGVAENRPYKIDVGPVNPRLGQTDAGTILPRETEGLPQISPDLAARRGISGLGEIAPVDESDRLLRQIEKSSKELQGNYPKQVGEPQLPSAPKNIIDLEPSEYKVENPNRNVGAGVKSIVSPGKEADKILKNQVTFPGVKDVKEIPDAGTSTASKDVGAFRAEYGSADKTLLSRPETAPIAKAITSAEDQKLQFVAGTERQLSELTKGLDSNAREQLGQILDGQQIDDPELQQRAQAIREILDQVHSQVPELKSTGRYVTDYLTHIAKEPDDLGEGARQIWEYHFKKPFKDLFGGESLNRPTGEEGDIYQRGIGNPSSPFVKERTGEMLPEYDVNKVLPAYIESIAKVIFDKPAVQAAKEALKLIPEAGDEPARLKELAQWYIRNYSRYDSEPGLSNAWNSWSQRLQRTANRSLLGFSTGLQSLHVARLAANLYPELPGKYLNYGLRKLISNPSEAYSETTKLGFLRSEIRPWNFKTPTQKLDSIIQIGSVADFLDKSIGYHGFKKMFMEQGLPEEQASAEAINASKRASLTVSPARAIRGFQSDAKVFGGAAGPLFTQYKQVPAKIIEQYIQIAADAKQNPAAARRMLTGVGLALAGAEAGIKTFHITPSSVTPSMSGGPVGATIYRIYNKLSKGDVEGALKDTVLFITPGGMSLKYQLEHGPSALQ